MCDYNKEVKQRWGETNEYKEYMQRSTNYNNDKWQEVNYGLNNVIAKFTLSMNNGYTSNSVETQMLVKELQAYITENYYTCTNKILSELGQMYVADERFKNNIDKHGVGTAEFISNAIKIYCK